MAFTANEMVTAIATTPANMDVADRFERASFAAALTHRFGCSDETAAQCLAWLAAGEVWFEDGPVSYLYRELVDFREANATEY
jgi:hypothetical protein